MSLMATQPSRGILPELTIVEIVVNLKNLSRFWVAAATVLLLPVTGQCADIVRVEEDWTLEIGDPNPRKNRATSRDHDISIWK